MTIKKLIGALALMGFMASANAASILLAPQGATDGLAAGDTVTFDVVMDFTDYPNGTIGGGFDIFFDSSVMQFESFFRDPTIGEADFSRDPDILDGLLESWAVAAFSPLPQFNILGTVTFSVLPTLGAGTTQIGTQATAGIGGPWVDGTTFIDLVPVDYGAVDVTGIPVPAAVWFMLSGLGALLGFGRRKAA